MSLSRGRSSRNSHVAFTATLFYVKAAVHPLIEDSAAAPTADVTGVVTSTYTRDDLGFPRGAFWNASGATAEMVASVHWLRTFHNSVGYDPFLIVAQRPDAAPTAFVPLCLVRSRMFGRFLVSLPYISSAGVMASDAGDAMALVDAAVGLADRLDVDYAVFRHERAAPHPALSSRSDEKVHMRLKLPDSAGALWNQLRSKVRNQIRKGERAGLTVHWGSHELLNDFYGVFARNMRDLGTPVFGRRLFHGILEEFQDSAELCVVRQGDRSAAAALLIHGAESTEVPSASSLRAFNHTNANMLMYWNLIVRGIQRGKSVFDFGRSSRESGTFRFKRQWGAHATDAHWQYYVRRGDPGGHRPDSPKYRAAIRAWRRLPVWITRLLGPPIVRGIP